MRQIVAVARRAAALAAVLLAVSITPAASQEVVWSLDADYSTTSGGAPPFAFWWYDDSLSVYRVDEKGEVAKVLDLSTFHAPLSVEPRNVHRVIGDPTGSRVMVTVLTNPYESLLWSGPHQITLANEHGDILYRLLQMHRIPPRLYTDEGRAMMLARASWRGHTFHVGDSPSEFPVLFDWSGGQTARLPERFYRAARLTSTGVVTLSDPDPQFSDEVRLTLWSMNGRPIWEVPLVESSGPEKARVRPSIRRVAILRSGWTLVTSSYAYAAPDSGDRAGFAWLTTISPRGRPGIGQTIEGSVEVADGTDGETVYLVIVRDLKHRALRRLHVPTLALDERIELSDGVGADRVLHLPDGSLALLSTSLAEHLHRTWRILRPDGRELGRWRVRDPIGDRAERDVRGRYLILSGAEAGDPSRAICVVDWTVAGRKSP